MKRFPKLVPYINGRAMQVFPRKGATVHRTTYFDYNKQAYVTKDRPVEWRENKPIRLALKFDGVYVSHKGNSGVDFSMLMEDGREVSYVMKLHVFNKMLQVMTFVTGLVVGDFVFERGGNNCYVVPFYMKTPEESAE